MVGHARGLITPIREATMALVVKYIAACLTLCRGGGEYNMASARISRAVSFRAVINSPAPRLGAVLFFN